MAKKYEPKKVEPRMTRADSLKAISRPKAKPETKGPFTRLNEALKPKKGK